MDETGDLGSTKSNKFYIICACLVSDPVGFSKPIEDLNLDFRFHANKQHKLATELATDILPKVLRIYHVALVKGEIHNPQKPMRHITHAKMLQTVADRILSDVPDDLEVTVDGSGIIPGTLVRGIFAMNGHRGDRDIKVNVMSSKKNKALQAHDVVTWLQGQMYNSDNEHSYLIMSRTNTAIVSRAEWYERVNDPMTGTLVSEDTDLHMLRWLYNMEFPDLCYPEDYPNAKLICYPRNWNDFIIWAYKKLQTEYSYWPEPLPDFESFKKLHPTPQRYERGDKSKPGRGQERTKNAPYVYETYAPESKSIGQYKTVVRSKPRSRPRTSVNKSTTSIRGRTRGVRR